MKNSFEAANLLDSIYDKYNDIVTKLEQTGTVSNKNVNRLRYRIKHLRLMEMPSNDSSLGFTLNKYEIVKIKLRFKNGSFRSMGDLDKVILHELAHVMSTDYGHTKEFHKNLKILTDINEYNYGN